MVAISFSVYKEKLMNGEKRQTIRKHNPDRIDQMKRLGIQIYWKQRSPTESEELFEAELTDHFVVEFQPSSTEDVPIIYHKDAEGQLWVPYRKGKLEKIARKDGFESYEKMTGWFEDKYGENIYPPTKFDVIRFEEV